MLLIDADTSVLSCVSMALCREGYVVTTARSGQEAVAILKGARVFDVVITGYDVPGMSGFAVLNTARQRMPQARTVLWSSGLLDGQLRYEFKRLGAEIVDRPEGPEDLECLLRLLTPASPEQC